MVPKSAGDTEIAEIVEVVVQCMAAPEPPEVAGRFYPPMMHPIVGRDIPEVSQHHSPGEAGRDFDRAKQEGGQSHEREKDEQAESVAETFKAKRAAIDIKVEEVKQKQVEAKQEDLYLPIRRESVRIIHLLERRDEEEEIKALSRRGINANDRELLRQAAIAKGTWYLDFVAAQFLPPLSAKRRITKEIK